MTLSLFDQFIPATYLGIPLILLALTLPWIFFPAPASRWISNRYLTVQNWAIAQFVQQLLLPINKAGHKWAVLFTSLVVFLITLNTFGLAPYTFTPTTQLSLNIGLAVPLWLATVIMGMRDKPTHALGHMLPEGTPIPLIPILIIIETISLLIRPLALGVRLTANLTAGHLLIQLISTAVFALLSIAPLATPVVLALLFLLNVLEVAVALIQAYVFVLLLSLYLQENV